MFAFTLFLRFIIFLSEELSYCNNALFISHPPAQPLHPYPELSLLLFIGLRLIHVLHQVLGAPPIELDVVLLVMQDFA